MCGQINLLIALTDIGPGDGATMVIPGSHKSNFEHPHVAAARASVDEIEEAIELPMRAGDALLFVDAISHGSAKRVNPGIRRIVVYRYGPSWGNFRHGYQPSPELLARLTPERRRIVQPQRLLPREPNRLPSSG
jgi:ectoine hydroxylase-related dioxygenase (phytanoyl-CoA dioxygenase family)